MATADYKKGLLDRLQNPEYASQYLNEALKRRQPGDIHAGTPGRSKKLEALPRQPGNQISTGKPCIECCQEKGNPNLSSLNKLLDSLGLTLTIGMKETVV